MAIKNAKAVAVMDKSEGLSALGGPVFADVCAALCQNGVSAGPLMVNYVYGLGGRDVKPEHIAEVFADLADDLAGGLAGRNAGVHSAAGYRYLAVRE